MIVAISARKVCPEIVRVAGIVAALSIAPSAHASPLEWSAPAACPARDDVQARIERRLGASLDALERRVTVDVSRDGGAFIARVSLDSESDHELRTLSAESCDALADAVTVIVARVARVRPHMAMMPAPATALELAVPHESPPIDNGVPVSIDVRLAALASIGVLPGAAVGGEVAAIATSGAKSFELAFIGWRETQMTSPTQMLLGVALDQSSIAMRGGLRLGALPVHVRAGVEVGLLRGTGLGETGTTATAPWYAATVGAVARWHAGRWLILESGADLAVSERVRFQTDASQDVYVTGVVSARLSVGAEVVLR